MNIAVLGMPRIPLIEDLTTEPIPAGSAILIEYDPGSQWYNASLTIAAHWLRHGGGSVTYNVAVQPPDDIRSRLIRLGLDVDEMEKFDAQIPDPNRRLEILDWYTATLGQKSKEQAAPPSLKVSDLSIWVAKGWMSGPLIPNALVIADDRSFLARFNDEKFWVEWEVTRIIPATKSRKMTALRAVIRGLHSDWAYRTLEAASDGVVEFKLEDSGDETRNLIRIRNMRNVAKFDSRWHLLKVGENFEVTLEK